MVVVFEVPGTPGSKGRPRFRSAGKYVQTYTPDKTVVYENFVRQMWLNTGHDKLVGNICATIDAYFPIPKSISKKKHDALVGKPYPKKPDADNIAKAILDALNGIAYDDDSAVVVLTVFKRYGEEPRVEVSLQTED